MAKFFTPTRLSENIRETPEGYLFCLDVPIARTGWQEYGPGETPLEVGEDGLVWIHRDPDEVFRPQTLASFNGKPVTIKHPQDFVDPTNWKMLSHGVAQNIRKGEEKDEDGEEMILADLLVTDQLAIGLIKQGLREVSCGYDAEYEQTDDGEGRQFNIVGNHIALVEQGRAGSTYAIRDHKGKVNTMNLKKLAEAIKHLGKTVDAAEKLEAKKEEKAKDEGAAPEQTVYDDLMKHIKDLGEKVAAMAASKKEEPAGDEEKPEEKKEMPKDEEKHEEKKEMPKDSDEEMESGQNSRLEKLEAAVAKILESLGNKGAEDEEEESDMSGDEYGEEKAKDEEGEEGEESQKKMKAGDAAHFEILTPGMKFEGKDARLQCLKAFAQTKDGSKILAQLGLEKPVFDSKTNADMIFIAASALVKSERGVGLKSTKDGSKWTDADVDNTASDGMSPEQVNELNAKHWGMAK